MINVCTLVRLLMWDTRKIMFRYSNAQGHCVTTLIIPRLWLADITLYFPHHHPFSLFATKRKWRFLFLGKFVSSLRQIGSSVAGAFSIHMDSVLHRLITVSDIGYKLKITLQFNWYRCDRPLETECDASLMSSCLRWQIFIGNFGLLVTAFILLFTSELKLESCCILLVRVYCVQEQHYFQWRQSNLRTKAYPSKQYCHW